MSQPIMFDNFKLPEIDLSSLELSSTMLSEYGLKNVAVTVAGLVFLLLLRRATKKQQYPIPPGPKPMPIVGNYYQMPKKEGWFLPALYRDIGRANNTPVISLWLFGVHVVMVNTSEAAKDLFQTRGHIYNSRPKLHVLKRIARLDWFISLMQPDEHWKHNRKTLLAYYKQNEYRDVEARSAHTLLRGLLSTPDEFLLHFRRMNTATTMAVTYGIDMADGANERFIDVGKGMMHAIWDGTSRAALSFDSVPSFFSSWPNWLFGLNYTRNPGHDMAEEPFKEVQRLMAQGKAKKSIVYDLLNIAQTEEDELLAKNTGANVYLSGANKVSAPLGAFIRAMIKYPEAQRRAQKELDAVLGGTRLPDFADQPSLPYIEAILKEVLRWHPTAPFATAHAAGEDDVYKGYLIPKGTVVVGNAWAMLYDETIYPEPHLFKPERWFDRPAGEFPFATFGFGKRLCPGIPFSRDMMWITIASILAAFDIAPTVDSAGKPVVADDSEDWTYTLFSYPLPFPAKITPRSTAAKQLILATASEEPLTSF